MSGNSGNSPFKRAFRGLMACLVRIICRTRPGGTIDASSLRRLLVIRVDPRVGDVLLTTPLIRALRKGLPGCEVDVLVASGKQKLIQGLAHHILLFAKKDFFRHPLRFWRSVIEMRRQHYDAVIDASHWHMASFTSAALAFLSGAPIRVGHLRDRSDLFLTHPVPKNPANEREVPSKLELLLPFGVPSDGEAMETTVDGTPEGGFLPLSDEVRAVLGGKKFIAFNPGARKADRRWSPEGFGKLARTLAEASGFVPLILWGPGEEEIAARVVAASENAAVLAPPTDLAMLAACFRSGELVVTNDTGPMHLAVATGTPVLAVFTFEDGPRWAPETGPKFQGLRVNGVDDISEEAISALLNAGKSLLCASEKV